MSMPLHPSEATWLGDYQLLGRLGRGGMGAVYLGRAPDGGQVAVKVIRAELSDDELRARFRSEVKRLRQVPSFSTAAVLDADVDHDPPYLVLEYVDGPSLADVVRDRGPLPPEQLRGVAVGITTALAAIHGAGVIHRDLKPENVLLPVGGVKVIDFGIARTLEATSLHTRTDQMVGTVAYMAPERFASDGSRTVTPAADVFAWGVLVAYAATGRTPFAAGSPPATAMRILSQPPDLDGLTEPIRGLVGRALAKDPRQRPTARQLLDGLLTEDTVVLSPPPVARPPAAPVPRSAPVSRSAPVPVPRSAPVSRSERVPRSERAPRSLERLAARTARRRKRNAFAAAGGAVGLTVAAVLGFALTPFSAPADSPRPGAVAVRQAGGVAAADRSGKPTRPAAAPSDKATTPAAMLELLSRIFPDRKLTRGATVDGRLWVQVLADSGNGPGRVAVEVSRDKNPDSDVRTTGPRVAVQHDETNCIEDTLVRADWDDGTHVIVTVSTCLPWDGAGNDSTAPALTVAEAKRVASDPRWGTTMDSELITAGATSYPKLLKVG